MFYKKENFFNETSEIKKNMLITSFNKNIVDACPILKSRVFTNKFKHFKSNKSVMSKTGENPILKQNYHNNCEN